MSANSPRTSVVRGCWLSGGSWMVPSPLRLGVPRGLLPPPCAQAQHQGAEVRSGHA